MAEAQATETNGSTDDEQFSQDSFEMGCIQYLRDYLEWENIRRTTLRQLFRISRCVRTWKTRTNTLEATGAILSIIGDGLMIVGLGLAKLREKCKELVQTELKCPLEISKLEF